MLRMNALGARVAVKTGTSNGQIGEKVVPKDLWTVGYTPSIAMAVWLGNPDTTPLTRGNSLIPALLLDRTMATVTQKYVEQGKAKYSDWYRRHQVSSGLAKRPSRPITTRRQAPQTSR